MTQNLVGEFFFLFLKKVEDITCFSRKHKYKVFSCLARHMSCKTISWSARQADWCLYIQGKDFRFQRVVKNVNLVEPKEGTLEKVLVSFGEGFMRWIHMGNTWEVILRQSSVYQKRRSLGIQRLTISSSRGWNPGFGETTQTPWVWNNWVSWTQEEIRGKGRN
jgi:hypothetical protein